MDQGSRIPARFSGSWDIACFLLHSRCGRRGERHV